MATYLYETVPADPATLPRRFEVQQSMKDDPLSHDPESGDPVKRVISGGFGYISTGNSAGAPGAHDHASPGPSSGCGHSACGCGHAH